MTYVYGTWRLTQPRPDTLLTKPAIHPTDRTSAISKTLAEVEPLVASSRLIFTIGRQCNLRSLEQSQKMLEIALTTNTGTPSKKLTDHDNEDIPDISEAFKRALARKKVKKRLSKG